MRGALAVRAGSLNLLRLGVAAIIPWLCFGLPLDKPPSDLELLEKFKRQQVVFVKVRNITDELSRNGTYFSVRELPIKDQDQKQQYIRLLNELGPGTVVLADYQRQITKFLLTIDGHSSAGSGWIKAIEYIPGNYSRAGVLVSNLDGAAHLPTGIYLRSIGQGWFIVYERLE